MKTDIVLEVEVGAGNIVHMTIGGDVSAEQMSKLTEWTQKVKDVIQSTYKGHGPVLCLVDITGLLNYHADVLTTLAGLMKDNEPYVLRTATFGGNSAITMAEDIVIALSGRNNLKAFDSKEKALDWLKTGIEIADNG